MKRVIFLIGMVLISASAFAGYIEIDGDAPDAQRQFSDAVKAYPNSLVEFYDVNCGFCKRMIPTVDEFAKEKQVIHVSVDHTKLGQNKFASNFSVRGTPTLFMVKDGKFFGRPHFGAMPAEAFKKYVNNPELESQPSQPNAPKLKIDWFNFAVFLYQNVLQLMIALSLLSIAKSLKKSDIL